MTVQPAESSAPAEWLLPDRNSWWYLVRFGPRGFERYIRIAFHAHDPRWPSPTSPEDEQPALRQALALLGEHTATPSRAYAAIWEGWTRGDRPSAPVLPIPNRTMLLFQGDLTTMRDAPGSAWQGQGRVLQEPHLVWPEDRSWLVACEVYEEIEFTVGCAEAAADALIGAFGLGARSVTYGENVPLYLS